MEFDSSCPLGKRGGSYGKDVDQPCHCPPTLTQGDHNSWADPNCVKSILISQVGELLCSNGSVIRNFEQHP